MTEPCLICGNVHAFKCPLIKAFEYYEDGRVKRTEFITFVDIAAANNTGKVSADEVVFIHPEHPGRQ